MKLKDEGFGAYINGIHTFKDLGLVTGNNDVVGEAEVMTNYVTVPGSNKRIDLTESITGYVPYERRELKFELGTKTDRVKWPILVRKISNIFHGRKVKVILDSEPDYYFEGRAKVKDTDRSTKICTCLMEIDCDPYKYDRFSSLEDWEWDSFNFETGVIRDSYKDIKVAGNTVQKFIEGSAMPVTLKCIVSNVTGSANFVACNGKAYSLKEGENRFPDVLIGEEGVDLYFTGTYTVSINYRGGSL
jgi:hypothetical protein